MIASKHRKFLTATLHTSNETVCHLEITWRGKPTNNNFTRLGRIMVGREKETKKLDTKEKFHD